MSRHAARVGATACTGRTTTRGPHCGPSSMPPPDTDGAPARSHGSTSKASGGFAAGKSSVSSGARAPRPPAAYASRQLGAVEDGRLTVVPGHSDPRARHELRVLARDSLLAAAHPRHRLEAELPSEIGAGGEAGRGAGGRGSRAGARRSTRPLARSRASCLVIVRLWRPRLRAISRSGHPSSYSAISCCSSAEPKPWGRAGRSSPRARST
jgi:hypothetical protein